MQFRHEFSMTSTKSMQARRCSGTTSQLKEASSAGPCTFTVVAQLLGRRVLARCSRLLTNLGRDWGAMHDVACHNLASPTALDSPRQLPMRTPAALSLLLSRGALQSSFVRERPRGCSPPYVAVTCAVYRSYARLLRLCAQRISS
jgi:hypothetical protein